MDTPDLPTDDLNDLERRLAGWRPSTAGLAPDAMLFAAGRASAQRGKAWLAWPILSGCLALAAVILGVWLAAERSERRALLQALDQRPSQPAPAKVSVPNETRPTEPPAPDSYLSLRRAWEQHPSDWANRPVPPARAPKRPTSPERPIPRAWQPPGPL
jgi:hypothetical protein